MRPLLGLGHELAVTGLAFVAHLGVATGWWEPLITRAGLDPIYTGTAVRALGGVQVLGLAAAGPLGDWLHAMLPPVFQPPQQVAAGAGISMVAGPGSPALGRGLAGFGADVIWLTVGLVVFARWRGRAWQIALLGLFIQAQIAVNHLFNASVNLSDLEASGVPFAMSVALPGASGGAWFTSGLAQLPEWVQDIVIGGALLLAGYAAAATLLATGWTVCRLLRRQASPAQRSAVPAAHGQWRRVPLAPIGAALAVVLAVSPIGALAFGQPNWQANPMSTSALHSLSVSRTGRATGLSQGHVIAGPSTVTIQQARDGSWQYLVNSQPTVIRGVGYNPQYASLSSADRQQLYHRDFGAMRRLGVNTIEGWFETQFDGVTLDAAEPNGIGILMPFELNQDWPYENPNVRQSILDHVSAYVERYKNHPAVRMWAPGNENLHRILYPHLVSKQNEPQASARAAAFAAFLPALVDRIHQLDPNHPVLYRDAEDVYLPQLKSAFEATGVLRPWLIYGANVYSSTRLRDIIGGWPAQWIGGPLVISEFGPSGAGRADRALGYQQEWSIIRSRPDVVLGGLAYTWATNGPEELDRVFGLVDSAGVPTDGSLASLSAAFLQGA
ncbi:MAG: hypothetical protein LC797_06710 [Chloroflexi bacterium]|nr:hypothetical protein [Chloroflexota bacterium]